MSMKRSLILLFVCIVSYSALALTTFKPDFSTREGLATETGAFDAAEKLVIQRDDNGTPYLELRRGALRPQVRLAHPIGENDDFGYSLTLLRESDVSSAGMGFKAEGENYCVLMYVNPSGMLNIHNGNTYEATGFIVKPNVPTHISVSVSRQSGKVSVKVGDVEPYETNVVIPQGLKYYIFSPQPPDGNVCRVFDFECHYGAARILTRQNIAMESTCVLEPNPTLANVTSLLSDLDYDQQIDVPEQCELLYELPHPAAVTAVQLFGGRPGIASYPSGACAPKHYVIEGFADNEWKTLLEVADAADACANAALLPKEQFVLNEFEPTVVERVRIRFIESRDTGMRLSGPAAPGTRSMALREVQIFTDVKVEPSKSIKELIQCDWRLPFYRNATEAQLYMDVADVEQVPDSVRIAITDSADQLVREDDMPLHVGCNIYTLKDIGDWDGRYIADISIAGGSKMRRMLRLEHVPEVSAAVEPMAMGKGRKVFFTPDDYVLAESRNLKVEVFPASGLHMLAHTPEDDPTRMICMGNDFYQLEDGRFVINVVDRPFNGFTDININKDKHRRMISDTVTGPYRVVPEGEALPPRKAAVNFFKDYRQGSFRRPNDGTKFEIFDPAKHGEVDLSTMSFKYIYSPYDFGCLTASKTALWLTARSTDGTWILPKDKPLFEHFVTFSDASFDTGMYCNDNFGDFWLSEDGGTLYLAQGQTVRRSAPMAVPYDNFQLGMRMMTVYSTQDGVNWKYENTLVPTGEDGTFGAQHYGSMRLPLAQGDLVLMYIYAYDSDAQQIYIELAYSRDNHTFHRFPGAPAFARGADPSSWCYGHIFANKNIIQVGDRFFEQIGYCTPLAHFVHESYARYNCFADVTADDFKRCFQRRDLDRRWPFFDSIGGWEGLAEYTRNGYYSNGVMEYRAYGWFGLKAGAGEGQFTTRRMAGGKTLTANAECGPGGYVEIEAVSASDGRRLAVARINGDGAVQSLFTLPDDGTEYFLRGRMKDAVLYTLDFAE